MRPRNSGGIGKQGGSNVNPIYRPFKAVSDAVGRYMENTAEGYRQADIMESRHGRKSPQFKKAQDNLQGAVFQNRKPPKLK
jgi:hypothetical protein